MGESPAEAGRSPFARFPWVQLAFCLACVSMAAWTWMRYSCPRDMAVRDFYDGLDIWAHGPSGMPRHPLEGEYVRLHGVVIFAGRLDPAITEYQDYWLCGVADDPSGRRYVEVLLSPTWIVGERKEWAPLEIWEKSVVGEHGVFVGRFVSHGGLHSTTDNGSIQYAALDTTASRLHPVSVAGLVVGAMGCFIFGLYLRQWLLERKAAA